MTPEKVLICQNRTCKKQGADKVLAAFQASPVPGVTVVASSCLRHCGSGPMVLVEPGDIWYCGVRPEEVATVVERHLKHGVPVKAMLFHPPHP